MLILALIPILIAYRICQWLYRKTKKISFLNKVVWITGASSGIGEEMTYQFAKLGAILIISARREAELERVKKACVNPDKITVFPLDLADPEQAVVKATEFLEKKGLSIDILINNSGIGMRTFFLDMKPEAEREMMNVNYFAPIRLTRVVLPKMLKEKQGQIVLINSVAGKISSAMRSSYSGSKFALLGFFDSFRAEYSDQGITVTSILAGAVNTDITANGYGPTGGIWKKRDPFNAHGLSVQAFAETALRSIYFKDSEATILKEYYMWILIWLRNVWPEGVFFATSKHKKSMLKNIAKAE
jgi:short-subunit dehydrogenase